MRVVCDSVTHVLFRKSVLEVQGRKFADGKN